MPWNVPFPLALQTTLPGTDWVLILVMVHKQLLALVSGNQEAQHLAALRLFGLADTLRYRGKTFRGTTPAVKIYNI